MKSLSVAQLGLSLVGLYALVQALVLFPSLASLGSLLLERQQAVVAVSVTLLPFALLVALGVLLLTSPDRIARWILRGTHGNETLPVPEELAALLFSISGILIVAAALPDLVSIALRYVSTGGAQVPEAHWLAGHLARLVLGLFLFFRPGAVLEFWRSKAGSTTPPKDSAR